MTAANVTSANEMIASLMSTMSRVAGRTTRRLRKPLMIIVGSVILLMLLIVVLQSGLGVDSEDTITDSHRPEIVGE